MTNNYKLIPNKIIFETFLETNGETTFKEGQKITQWYKLKADGSSHEEKFQFSFVYGDYGKLVDTTMKQTCTKKSVSGNFDLFFKDDECPWVSDDAEWSFDDQEVYSQVSRPVLDFKKIEYGDTFTVQAGYTIADGDSEQKAESEEFELTFLWNSGRLSFIVGLALATLVSAFII